MVEAPSLLLHHDGELDDIGELLRSLGAHFEEQRGRDPDAGMPGRWDVIVATPRRLLRQREGAHESDVSIIAVLDGDSRTLRAHLRRMNIALMIRRPVHPQTLRQIVLHALYCGPERRNRERVSVGLPVSIRSGVLPRAAILADLSQRGCRLLSSRGYETGQAVRIVLPAEVTSRRSLGLLGRVLRSRAARPGAEQKYEIAVGFAPELGRPGDSVGARLRAVVERFREGPPSLTGAAGRARAATSVPLDETGAAPPRASPASLADEAPQPAGPDRRTDPRLSYDRRVVALSEQATRVLIGRDISRGGMRVEPNPKLVVGEALRIALYALARQEPLVVEAHVERDDGDAGVVLRFDAMDPARTNHLERIIEDIPVIDGDGQEAERSSGEASVIVSEIVEVQSA